MIPSRKMWNYVFYFGMISLISHQVSGKATNIFNDADNHMSNDGGKDDVPNSLDEIPQGNDILLTDTPEVTANKSKHVEIHGDVNVKIDRCFPYDAYVRREDGVKLLMTDLKIGDRVLTLDERGDETYSEVIMMLHQNREDVIKDYVQITTKDDFQLTLSTYHLIAISSPTTQFVYGKDVRPGDNVTVYNRQNFSSSEVLSVELVTKKGAFAPLTMEGSVVVNDIYASCYASFPNHKVAHIAFSLWRWVYTYFASLLELSTKDTEIHWYPRMLMSVNSVIGY